MKELRLSDISLNLINEKDECVNKEQFANIVYENKKRKIEENINEIITILNKKLWLVNTHCLKSQIFLPYLNKDEIYFIKQFIKNYYTSRGFHFKMKSNFLRVTNRLVFDITISDREIISVFDILKRGILKFLKYISSRLDDIERDL
jgi:hypothetical protein